MAELLLHKSLYDAAVVRAVAALYEGVAAIGIDEAEHELIVRFDRVDPDVAEVILDHFANHALVETVRANAGAEAALQGGQP